MPQVVAHNEEMPIRNEWTEWHLTRSGWKKGSTRVQGVGNTWTEEPEDRVISCVYKEVQSGSLGEPLVSAEESWRSKTATDIDSLLRQFGACPNQL